MSQPRPSISRSHLEIGRTTQRRDLGASLGHDGRGSYAEILAAMARRDAGRNFTRDLLDDIRWRLRAFSEFARRLFAWRRRVSRNDRSHRAWISRSPGPRRDG